MINDNFSLMKGGLVYRLLSAIGALHPGTPTTSWVAAILIGIAFLPLLAISTWEGTLLGQHAAMPLLGDYAVLSRFLLAMPMLILAAPWSDRILRGAARQLAYSDLTRRGRRSSLAAIFVAMRRLRDSNLPELVCVALAVLPSLAALAVPGAATGHADWRMSDTGSLSAAGQWFNAVSVPAFRFVALIWLWRFCLWAYLLWRLSRIELDLHPAHPDGAGGLGFLGLAQERFGALSAAGGLVLLGYCINRILYYGETVAGLTHLLAGYIIGSTMLLVAPLLLLAPRMMAAKRHALMKYDALGNRTVRAFDRRWRRGRQAADAATLLDQADASGLADFTSVYGTVRSMSIVPVTRWNLLWIAVHGAVPLTPLIFFAMSVDELVRKLFGILA
ncbi:hypothetical protein M2650_04825 [Luteimonas sp. SX5]|uniref:Uncharacterized protein n=1 Tax=Luteimonas galliterrae TaxID=2940486 RepID=A0ABT0MGG4_9GAMM|nr:hypothetical protein [Luteimonas galliterrae]MCL1633966.1 hypothetical protein [Luteimonas galliterrae]